MCADIAKFKQDLLTGKDKWADSEPSASSTEDSSKAAEPKQDVKKADLKNVVKDLGNVMVQKYMENPCLYKGRKFDMRCFMVVICARPWFVYAHPGYTRISLEEFTMDDFGQKTKEARIRHLTNLSIQKKSTQWKDRKHETVINQDELAEYLVAEGKLKDKEEY